MLEKTKVVEVDAKADSRLVEVRLTGKLDKGDYEEFFPLLEGKLREQGALRLLVRLEDFGGWTVGGLWEDIKFDAKLFADIERIAIVGEDTWEKAMTMLCKPFTKAEVVFYAKEHLGEARAWVSEGLKTREGVRA